MARYLIAHDLGTTGNKATLFTVDGRLVQSITYAYRTNFHNNNWAEQNPRDWWRAVCETTKSLLIGRDAKDVAGIAFSGQMMGCVVVDKDGKLLRDAIIWADQRSVKEAEEIKCKIEEKTFYHTTGHRISPSYSIEKLMWIRNNEPSIFKEIHKMLQPKDYIIYRLTRQYVTDYSDASGTNAFDLNRFEWSDKILDSIGISRSLLPNIYPSTHIAGEVLADVAKECGLAVGTKVVIGGGDGVCASVGAGSITENTAYNYLGSSSWITLATKEAIYDEKMRTFNWAHIVPGLIAPTGTMQAAGNSFAWMKNTLCTSQQLQAIEQGKDVYDIINSQIEKSSIGANGLLFMPYLLGERSPRWNPNARGAFIGLKMEHTMEDMLRATVEGIIMNLSIILDIFKQHVDIQSINIIGGLAKGVIQRQIMADVYGVDICKLNYLEEATSMGAAVTAGVGVGELKGFECIHDFIKVDKLICPVPSQSEKYKIIKEVFDKSYYALEPIYEELLKIK